MNPLLLLTPLEAYGFLCSSPGYTPPLLLGLFPVWPLGQTEKTEAHVDPCSGQFQAFPSLSCTRTVISSNCVLTRIWNVNNTVCLIEIGAFGSTFALDYIPSSFVCNFKVLLLAVVKILVRLPS